MKTEAEVWVAAAAMAARASETYDGIARLCEQEGDAQGLQAAVARRDVTDALASGFTIRASEAAGRAGDYGDLAKLNDYAAQLKALSRGSHLENLANDALAAAYRHIAELHQEAAAQRAIAEAAQAYVRWLDDESPHTGDGETGDRLETALCAALKAGGL